MSTGRGSINSLQGYNFVYTTCTTSLGTGSGFFVHNELTYKVRDDLIFAFSDEIESTTTEVSFQNQKNLMCLCVYRHLHMSINKFNEDYLNNLLS